MSKIDSFRAGSQVQGKDKGAGSQVAELTEKMYLSRSTVYSRSQSTLSPGKIVVAIALLAHLLLPWRHVLYPGELFWTEQGYRFSWRVMLMEKAGYLIYRVEDPNTGKRIVVDPASYLTTFQHKQLATQPDFILEFAHFLATENQVKDGPLPAVFAESYVALNGRGSRAYVNPDINLTTITYDTPRQDWLMPFEETIYGL